METMTTDVEIGAENAAWRAYLQSKTAHHATDAFRAGWLAGRDYVALTAARRPEQAGSEVERLRQAHDYLRAVAQEVASGETSRSALRVALAQIDSEEWGRLRKPWLSQHGARGTAVTDKTWNHPAVRRFFKRYAEQSGGMTHLRASTSIPVEPFGEAHRIDAYLLAGPFEPRWDNDLSHRAKASIRKAQAAFVTIERWVDQVSVTYFTEAEGGMSEAQSYYDGFLSMAAVELIPLPPEQRDQDREA